MSKQGYFKKVTVYLEISFNNVPRYIETKQSFCNKNQLAGFYTAHVFIESNFRTNSNLNENKNNLPNHQTKKTIEKVLIIVVKLSRLVCVFNANSIW